MMAGQLWPRPASAQKGVLRQWKGSAEILTPLPLIGSIRTFLQGCFLKQDRVFHAQTKPVSDPP